MDTAVLPYLVRVEHSLAGYKSDIEMLAADIVRIREKIDYQNNYQYSLAAQQATWISLRIAVGKLKFARRRLKERLEQIKDGSFVI